MLKCEDAEYYMDFNTYLKNVLFQNEFTYYEEY